MLAVCAALHDDSPALGLIQINQRDRCLRVAQFLHERRHIFRHAGAPAIEIKIPEPGIDETAFSSGEHAPPHQLHE